MNNSTNPEATRTLQHNPNSSADEFKVLEQSIIKLIHESKFIDSLKPAEILLNKFPNSPKAQVLYAEIHQNIGNNDIANKYLAKAAHYESDDIMTLGRLAAFQLTNGQFDAAIEKYQKVNAVSARPLAWVFVGLGNAFEKKGDIAASINNFEKALKLNPNYTGLTERLLKLRIIFDKSKNQTLTDDPTVSAKHSTRETVTSASPKKVAPEPAVAAGSTSNRLRGYVCFLSDSNSWFFSLKQRWYQIQDQDQLMLLLGTFSLRVFDRKELNFIPCSGGYVIVSNQKDNGYLAEFYKPDSKLIATEHIIIDEQVLIFAEWILGAYQDKWLATSAEIAVEGAKDIEFTFFIPKKLNSHTKKITIKLNGNLIFEEPIKLGLIFTTKKLLLDHKLRVNILNITSEYAEQKLNNESRELGVIVSQIKLNGMLYTPLQQ